MNKVIEAYYKRMDALLNLPATLTEDYGPGLPKGTQGKIVGYTCGRILFQVGQLPHAVPRRIVDAYQNLKNKELRG